MNKKWIWQSEKYPHFYFNETNREYVDVLLFYISEHNKTLNQIILQNNLTPILLESEINALTDEIINSASIEGEILKRDSVRSSLKKKLDKGFDFTTDKYSTRQSDNYASILLDTNLNKNPLSIQRMHGWHNCLFESGYSGLHKINIAKFRDDEIQVVSGAIDREKIHYEAIPVKSIHKDMEAFLHYCNDTSINPYIRSAIAHLWFVIIHPYDDGNGRIARAIADYLLPNKNIKLYSISAEINKHKKAYYEVLEKTNRFNANCDITEWLKWHLSMTKLAMQDGINKIEKLIYKTTFWDNFKHLKLNNNQQKVLNKILDIGIKDFKGDLNAKRYSRIAKIDLQTAQKEIDELCSLGCLIKKTNSYLNQYFVLPKNIDCQKIESNQITIEKPKIRRQ